MRAPPCRWILVLAALAAGCATGPAAPPAPALTLQKCGIAELQEPLLCGDLVVPENRAQPEGRKLKLNVVIVPATGEKTLPPLYDLAGGPGIAATGAARFWAGEGAIHRAHRDIVLMDQRGTGQSAPLPCNVEFSHPLIPVLDGKEVELCRDRLLPRADLAQYSTRASVQDLEALRAALNHERIDLHGLSYGSRLAQEYLRAYPQRVRAMALLGTLSPNEKLPLGTAVNAQSVLARLISDCAADKACKKAFPKLAADVSLVQSKVSKGVRLTLKDGRRVELDPGPFWESVRGQMATTTGQRKLPWLLHEAARGNWAPILDAAPAKTPGSNGLLLSVSCPEDTLHITPEELEPLTATVFGTYRVRQQISACKLWGVPLLDAALRPAFAESDVPVLLLAGDMDHVTPVQQAMEVAGHLPNARVVVIPALGHMPEGLSNMGCYDKVIAAFFTAGSPRDLDLDCLKTMKPPPFQTRAAEPKPG